MATKKTNSRKTSNNSSFQWGWIAAIALLVVLLGTNLTGVTTVRGDLARIQAQQTEQAAATATEAPATEAPAATAEPTLVPTLAAPATLVPTQAPAQPATPQLSAKDAHDQHLLALDPTFRSNGWENWLLAAGIEFDASKVESRQPVEEVIQGHVTVTSLVIRATGMVINWPACVTTDHSEQVKLSADTRQYQPDLRNASVMYTNLTLNGQGTVYADCSDWGQLNPTNQ